MGIEIMTPIHTNPQAKTYASFTETGMDEAKVKATDNVIALILKTITYCYSKEEAQQIKEAAKLAIQTVQDHMNLGTRGNELTLKRGIAQKLTTLNAKANQLFEELTQSKCRTYLEVTSTHKSFMRNKLINYFASATNYTNTNLNLIIDIDNINESELIHHDILSQGSVITPLPDLPAEVYSEIFNYMDKRKEQLALRLLSRHAEMLVTDRINPLNPLKFLKLKPDTNNLKESFEALCKYIASPRCIATHLDLSQVDLSKDDFFAELAFALKFNQSISNLNLESCGILGSYLEKLSILPNLTNLNLRNNSIFHIGAEHIAAHMPNLVILNASWTNLYEGLEHLFQLKKLKILDVSLNLLTDEKIPQNILPPESLTDLFISQVGGSPSEHLLVRLAQSIPNVHRRSANRDIITSPFFLLKLTRELPPLNEDWTI
jgi:hypothetical protein